MSALQAFRASRLALKQEQHRSRPRLTVCCRASAQPATHGSRRPLDIAIVGSGIGGLTAAAALAETGAMVRVFEARSQEEALAGPGGIMIQVRFPKSVVLGAVDCFTCLDRLCKFGHARPHITQLQVAARP